MSQFIHSSHILNSCVHTTCVQSNARLLCVPTHDPKVSQDAQARHTLSLRTTRLPPLESISIESMPSASSGPLSLMTTAHRSDPPLHCMLRNHALALKLCAPRAHHTKRIETARKAPRCHAMATDRTSQIGADRSGWHVQCPQRRSHSMWGRFHAP